MGYDSTNIVFSRTVKKSDTFLHIKTSQPAIGSSRVTDQDESEERAIQLIKYKGKKKVLLKL